MAYSIRQAQQGFSLLESMISVLLVAVLGLGMAYATSQVLLTQRYTTTQSLAVMQLREFMQTGEETEVSMADQRLTISDSRVSEAVTVEVAGKAKSFNLARGSIAVTSTELFSGDGKVSLTY